MKLWNLKNAAISRLSSIESQPKKVIVVVVVVVVVVIGCSCCCYSCCYCFCWSHKLKIGSGPLYLWVKKKLFHCIGFMVLKTIGLRSRFQHSNRFGKTCIGSWGIVKMSLNWRVWLGESNLDTHWPTSQCIFSNK